MTGTRLRLQDTVDRAHERDQIGHHLSPVGATQARVFGENVTLRRRISAWMGQSRLAITD